MKYPNSVKFDHGGNGTREKINSTQRALLHFRGPVKPETPSGVFLKNIMACACNFKNRKTTMSLFAFYD